MLGFTAIILLSFVLAISFLLVILSCALWNNWLPLFTGKHNQGGSPSSGWSLSADTAYTQTTPHP